MIRGFVIIALGGTLLVMGAVPALAEKAPPRPARSSTVTPRPAAPAPVAVPAQTAREDTREASVTRATRPGLKLPHPFREQVLPEGRV